MSVKIKFEIEYGEREEFRLNNKRYVKTVLFHPQTTKTHPNQSRPQNPKTLARYPRPSHGPMDENFLKMRNPHPKILVILQNQAKTQNQSNSHYSKICEILDSIKETSSVYCQAFIR